MKTKALLMMMLLGVAACGGEEDGKDCVGGVWKLTDTRTSYSGDFCGTDNFAAADETDTLVIDHSAKRFTWTDDDGVVYAGNMDFGSCSGTVTATRTGNFDDGAGGTVQATMTITRSFKISGSSMTGSGTVSIATSPVTTGTPCTFKFSSTGAKQ